MAKMGRPRIEIDWEEFDKLCNIQATLEEIAGWFNCSVDTIENRVKEIHGCTFSEHHKKKSAGGKASLRRAQFKVAMGGNATLLIWLGKQYLGQSDKQEQDVNITTGADLYKEFSKALRDAADVNPGARRIPEE